MTDTHAHAAAEILVAHVLAGIRDNRSCNWCPATHGWTAGSAMETYLDEITEIAGCEEVAAAADVPGAQHAACEIVSLWLESGETFAEDVRWAISLSDEPGVCVGGTHDDVLQECGEQHPLTIAYLGSEDVGVRIVRCGGGDAYYQAVTPGNRVIEFRYGELRDAVEHALGIYATAIESKAA